MRHWCAKAARPRLQHLPLRVWRQVRARLRSGIVLAPEQGLHVVQRHTILNQRLRTTSDMSPLNSCAFALLGLRRNEAVSTPGAWAI